MDKEGVDAQQIFIDLMNYDIVVEEYGGDVQTALISAKNNTGVDDLLEKILLQADVMDLRARTDIRLSGSVVESKVDKKCGVLTTVLVRQGMLRVGDILVAGSGWGKVKRILSDQGIQLKEVGPSTPVQVSVITIPFISPTCIVDSWI